MMVVGRHNVGTVIEPHSNTFLRFPALGSHLHIFSVRVHNVVILIYFSRRVMSVVTNLLD